MICLTSCNGCKSEVKTVEAVDTCQITNNVDTCKLALMVDNLVSMDRQEMYLNHGKDYRWFETEIKLNNYLDEENDGSIEELVNIFQAVVAYNDTCFDVKVYKFQHFSDGTCIKDSIDGFWVEDHPLNEEVINLTYKQAFDKLMGTNIVKPHSHYVTLRKMVGPIDANPQYIFGNIREVVFVDAVTGEVSGHNPAFSPEDGEGFNMPLGEWP